MVPILLENKIFAVYQEDTIRVYQAYGNRIADEIVRSGTFGSSFKLERMTWIKPSFLWMMYRCGWAQKEEQNRVFAIDIKRTGFESMLKNAVLSSYSPKIYASHEEWKHRLQGSEVRCQWDPERDIYGNPQEQRTIQLGLKGDMVRSYVNDWIVNLTEITQSVLDIREAIRQGGFTSSMLPAEREYTFLKAEH